MCCAFERRQSRADAIVIRPLQSSDEAALRLIFERMGKGSRVQRFLAPRPVFSEHDLSITTDLDGLNHGGVIALAGAPAWPIGAAHYVRAEGLDVAEIAIEVVDSWQRRGIGRLLIAELRSTRVPSGNSSVEWFALESNGAVAALARNLPDCRRVRVGDGVINWSAAARSQPEPAHGALLPGWFPVPDYGAAGRSSFGA